MYVNFNILNQLGSPSINSNTFANRPAAGQTGRLFVSTDTFEIYRDNGTTWDLIGGPGSSTIIGTGTATQVAYFTAAQSIGSSANLYWDSTNNNLLVGSSTSLSNSAKLQINGNTLGTGGLFITGRDALNAGALAAELGVDKVGTYGANTTVLGSINRSVIPATFNPMALEFTTLKLNFDGIVKASFDTNGSLAIGTAAFANTSSILDLVSTDRGFLQPRMTTAQRNAIATPATGLTIYNTTSNTIDYYNGTSWISLSTTTGTVTGTGAATQVAFWNAASNITGSNNLFWNDTSGRLGINTATPGVELDVHGSGTIQQLNTTGATANNYLAFQRTGTTTFSIGDTYNGGSNYFRIFGNSLSADILQIFAATGKSTLTSTETYSTGVARGNYLQYTLTVPAGTSFSTPNAITAFGATLDFRPAGNATIPGGARTGLDARTSVSFTGAGTLTMTQPGTNTRAFSNLTTGWAFAGTAIGTITELAGLRILFPDNSGSAINVTNNYALLINSQTANTGTITYTNRWAIYQEGASDLNYLAANLLIGSTTNSGEALQVTGTAKVTSTLTANSLVKSGGTAAQILAADGSVITAGTNITIAAGTISASGGLAGSGTTNYLPKFTAATTVGDSRFFDNGTVTFLGNGDVNAAPSTGIFSGTGGSGANIAGAELRIRGGASTGNAAGGPVTFYTSAAGAAGSGVNTLTEIARFNSSGNFGINTNSPNGKIDISVGNVTTLGSYSIGACITSSGGAVNNLYQIAFGYGAGGATFGHSAIAGLTESNAGFNNGSLIFATRSLTTNTAPIERMRINSSGSIGMGTTTIGSTLQVNGNAAIGYSASTAAPTNGLAVSGNVSIGQATSIYPLTAVTTGTNTSPASASNIVARFQSGATGRDVTLQFSDSVTNACFMSMTGGNFTFTTSNPSGVTSLYLANTGISFFNGFDVSATPLVGIVSGTGGSGANIAGAEFRIRGGASTGNATGGPVTFYTSAAGGAGSGVNAAVERLRISDTALTFADAINIAFNTTTGTIIGTATTQKLAFWNKTPIVQPTTAVASAARVGGGGATVTDTDTFGGYTIAQVVQALRNTGILA